MFTLLGWTSPNFPLAFKTPGTIYMTLPDRFMMFLLQLHGARVLLSDPSASLCCVSSSWGCDSHRPLARWIIQKKHLNHKKTVGEQKSRHFSTKGFKIVSSSCTVQLVRWCFVAAIYMFPEPADARNNGSTGAQLSRSKQIRCNHGLRLDSSNPLLLARHARVLSFLLLFLLQVVHLGLQQGQPCHCGH